MLRENNGVSAVAGGGSAANGAKSTMDHSDDRGVDIKQALDLIGTGRFHTLLLVVCGLSLLGLVTEMINLGFVVPAARCEFTIGTQQQGVLLSMGFLGVVVSSHLWGFLTDTWGRKKTLQLALVTSFVCSAVSAVSPSVGWLIGMRFATGVCVSGVQSAALVYLGEFHGHRTRARAVTVASMFMVLSLIFMALVALGVLPMSFVVGLGDFIEFRPWRLDILLCSSVLVAAYIGACFLPESPQFLLALGRHDDALAALQFAYHMNTGSPAKSFPTTRLHTDQVGQRLSGITVRAFFATLWQQTWPVFAVPLCWKTALMCYMSFVLFLVAHGMNAWLPHILTVLMASPPSITSHQLTMCTILTQSGHGLPSNDSTRLSCSDNRTDPFIFQLLLIYASSCMLLFFVVVLAMKKFDLKILLIVWLSTAAACGLGCLYASQYYVLGILMTVFLSCGNCGCIIGAVSQDLFPVNIRAMALCVIFMLGRIGSVLGSNLVGALIDQNCESIFILYAVLLTSCAGMCLLLPTNCSPDRE